MAGPYLKSGESIVLTTDRILIDDLEYDLILTTQRLTLVDSGHTSEQLRIVPFSTIISVKGGLTPAREPVITLTVTDPADHDATRTLDMVFSQQPYQDRSAECDLWVRKLIEYVVSVRQEPEPDEKPAGAESRRGMDPTVRRFIAPDAPLPRSEVPSSPRPSEELLRAMEQSDRESPGPGTGAQVAEEEIIPEPAIPPVPEEKDLVSAPSTEREVANPRVAPAPPVPEPVNEAGTAPEDAGAPTRVEPIIVPENVPAEEPPAPAMAPATPFRELVPEVFEEVQEYPPPVPHEEHPSGPAADMEELSRQIEETAPAFPENTGAERTGGGETAGIPESVVFPVLSGPQPENVPAPAAPAIPLETAEAAARVPPGPQVQKKRAVALVIGAVVILVIFGILTCILLLPSGESPAGPIQPVTTSTPAPLPVLSATPGPAPLEGVWLTVIYNGTYYGKYGNPGSLTEVRGSGEQVYPIRNSNGLVQASFKKLDYSGNTMTIEVYNNGTMITQASKSSPAGQIDLLVNSTTGKPPFVPVAPAGT